MQDPDELGERLRKTLYYGKPPSTDRPSLPLTGKCSQTSDFCQINFITLEVNAKITGLFIQVSYLG